MNGYFRNIVTLVSIFSFVFLILSFRYSHTHKIFAFSFVVAGFSKPNCKMNNYKTECNTHTHTLTRLVLFVESQTWQFKLASLSIHIRDDEVMCNGARVESFFKSQLRFA